MRITIWTATLERTVVYEDACYGDQQGDMYCVTVRGDDGLTITKYPLSQICRVEEHRDFIKDTSAAEGAL